MYIRKQYINNTEIVKKTEKNEDSQKLKEKGIRQNFNNIQKNIKWFLNLESYQTLNMLFHYKSVVIK